MVCTLEMAKRHYKTYTRKVLVHIARVDLDAGVWGIHIQTGNLMLKGKQLTLCFKCDENDKVHVELTSCALSDIYLA